MNRIVKSVAVRNARQHHLSSMMMIPATNRRTTNTPTSTTTTTTIRLRHTLPPLNYPINGGCLPCFSGKTLSHHYNKHHSSYVERLNQLLVDTPLFSAPLEHIISQTAFDTTKIDIYYNACQHFNHSFFWKCVRPSGSALPLKSKLNEMIIAKWGSKDAFEKEFTNAALNLFGSGWVWLVVDNNKELSIWSGKNADTPIIEELAPVLVVDVWEHAYYLDHKNSRAAYLESFWKVVDWSFVSQLFDQSLHFINEKL